jgi:transcriptional regulator with XRE-family HTH domain
MVVTSARTTVRDPLSLRVGRRIREARTRARLTQQQLAGERYTKAYVSALENGLIKPSVTALDFLAGRLGTSAGWLLGAESVTWTRLEADLELAAGNWQKAADAYDALLPAATDPLARAEILRGQAEAWARLDRGADAVTAASEAVGLFESAGRDVDAALASYWLSAGLFYQDNVVEAKAILSSVLGKVRAGLRVEPDFKLRLLMALSSNEAREGNHEQALSYLNEVRGLADTLDDRRRAAYLFDLAYSYCESGDFEAALRAGYASLALYAASDTSIEMAKVENEMALAYLGAGNLGRAKEMVASAHARFAESGDDRLLAHVLETEARIAAAHDDWSRALRLSDESITLAKRTENDAAHTEALLTAARAHLGLGDPNAAEACLAQAVEMARPLGRPALLRRALTERAELRAAQGDYQAAFELSREANQATH